MRRRPSLLQAGFRDHALSLSAGRDPFGRGRCPDRMADNAQAPLAHGEFRIALTGGRTGVLSIAIGGIDRQEALEEQTLFR